jgi:hypothetical protein
MTFAEQETTRAIAWKAHTTTLPEAARLPAPYVGKGGVPKGPAREVCLPLQHAQLTLLPEVREPALRLFAELDIPWHASVDSGPSNHLLSSQVQCVNALGQMVTDPARIVRAFGELLGIDEVLQIEPGRYLTFEYIGPTDFFGEAPGGQRIRGAHCTSVDAAFLHRDRHGLVELVLVEWKYTERYRARRPDPAKDAVRRRRYGAALDDPDGPVRADLLDFEDLLDEPLYQLVRQQLLAHELEKAGAEGASRVRVLHVLASENREYQQSLPGAAHRALGCTVSEVWQRLLRRPDRFTSVDPQTFLDPAVTSREYALRYAPDVIWDKDGLLAAFDLEAADDLEDRLYAEFDLDSDVFVRDHGVEIADPVADGAWSLEWPFRAADLRQLAADVAADEERT